VSGSLNFDVGPKKLWTPERDVDLEASRNVKLILAPEMRIIEAMHTVANRHEIVLACTKCRRPFQGFNAGQGQTQAISCGCRELRAQVRRSGVVLA
jgi:hypothetical protein